MILKKSKAISDYLENWPEHYYEISEPKKKKEILQKAIEQKLDENDKYRLKIFEKRYGKSMKSDMFMYSWMMIKVAAANKNVNFVNQRLCERELRQNMEKLLLIDYKAENENEKMVLMEEWAAFAKFYISSCLGSKTYCSTFFGMVPVKEDDVAKKIAAEIELVAKEYPQKFSLEKEFLPLLEIFEKKYSEMLDGEFDTL